GAGRRGGIRPAHPHRDPARRHPAAPGGSAPGRGARPGGTSAPRWCGTPRRSAGAPAGGGGAAVTVRLHSPEGRGVLLASVVGSGMAFLDGTVVTVALPALGRSLHTDLAGLQWTINAYLVTLSAFLLTGGGLGDRLGRKNVFSAGVVGFAAASVLCGLAG